MAPVAIPPDVNVRFFNLPRANALGRHIDSPTSAMEVVGPQGSWMRLTKVKSWLTQFQVN